VPLNAYTPPNFKGDSSHLLSDCSHLGGNSGCLFTDTNSFFADL